MNQLKSIVIGAACLLAACTSSFAQSAPGADTAAARYAVAKIQSSGSAPKTTFGVISAKGAGAPLLKGINWRADTTAGTVNTPINFFICTNAFIVASNAPVAVSNIFLTSVTGLFVNDLVCVRSASDDNYFVAQVASTNALNCVLTNTTSGSAGTMTLPFAVSTGSIVYRLVTNQTLYVTSTNSLYAPGGIYAGQFNVPLVIQAFGTNTTGLEGAVAEYK